MKPAKTSKTIRHAWLHLLNMLSLIAPVREVFGLRRILARLGGIEYGEGTRICTGVQFFGDNIRLGRRCWVSAHTKFYCTRSASIKLGDQCSVGPSVVFVTDTHELGGPDQRAGRPTGHEIVVGRGSWIGARSVILAGANIGCGSVVAAGSVVLKGEYPANALLAGVPAVVKRTL